MLALTEKRMPRLNGQPYEYPRIIIKCDTCSSQLDFGNVSRPSARRDARALGWDFVKDAKDGNIVEVWYCAGHARDAREKALRDRRESLLAYSDDDSALIARKVEKQLRELETKKRDGRAGFERHFSATLTGNEMGACLRLRRAVEIFEIAGNATASYDGISVDSFNFGSKSIQDKVTDASFFKRSCETTIIAAHDRTHWRVLLHAVYRDFSTREAGDFWARLEKSKAGRDKRASMAREIVQNAASAIVNIKYPKIG